MIPIEGNFTDVDSVPSVRVRFEYEFMCKDGNVYYRLAVIIPSLGESVYFPYDLRADIFVGGKKIVNGKILKEYTLKNWVDDIIAYFPASEGWYQLDDTSNQTDFTAKIYSSQTTGIGGGTGILVFDAAQYNIRIKTENMTWKSAEKVFLKIGKNWIQANKVYIKVGGNWREA